MIAKYNERITITLSKSLIKRLKKICKFDHRPISKYIAYAIDETIRQREWEIHYANLTDEEKEYLNNDLQEQIRIAKTPWLDNND